MSAPVSGFTLAGLMTGVVRVWGFVALVAGRFSRHEAPQNAAALTYNIYWAVLSLGPLLIGASLLATSYLISLPIVSDAASAGFGRRLLGLTPVVASTIAFTMMYLVVPNRRVRLAHALVGGVFAALRSKGPGTDWESTSPGFRPTRRSTGLWRPSRSFWSGCICHGSWSCSAPRLTPA